MMSLHWSPKSPYVRKVMVFAHELGLTEQIRKVRSVAAMQRPNQELMRDNPLAKIPALIRENGQVLFDSVVICEYLNQLAEGNLFPESGEEKWQALRWHALADGLLDTLILWRNERDERSGPAQSEVLLAAFELKTRAVLRLLEKEAPGIVQSPLSIGTITIACALGYADFRFAALAWREQAPGLVAWHARLMDMPSFKATSPLLD